MRQHSGNMKQTAVLTFLILFIYAENTHGANIPDYLLECYTNRTLLERDYRLPASLTSLVDVIRKLEETTPDMRTLSTSILYTFRVDGILYDPQVTASDLVSPYGIKGFQKYKHSLLYQYFLPENVARVDLTLLSSIEKCGLHFMLSDSIEVHQRGDESTVCSRLSSMRRVRRETPVAVAVANYNATSAQMEMVNGSHIETPPQEEITQKESQNVTNTPTEVKLVNLTKLNNSNILNIQQQQKTNDTQKTEEEVQLVIDASTNEEKTQEAPVKEKANLLSKSAKMVSQKATTITLSTCPVENGVIYTKWGPVSGANLLAGIVTGLQTMSDVKFSDIAPKFANTNTSSFIMDNRWAATLAGDLAEVVSLQAPKSSSSSLTVGSAGGWNDTMIPHWYFIQRTQNNQMTDAEIRGSLDGLIIATNIATWRSQRPNFRLSQLLERYYSDRGVFDTQYRACSRRNNYATVTAEPSMTTQVESFAYTLYTVAEDTVTFSSVDAVKQFSTTAISALNSYVPTFETITCNTQVSTTTTNASVVTEVDLYIVIDRSWLYRDIHRLIISIAEMADLSRLRGSKVTVLTGNTFQTIVNGSMSYTEFYQYFNQTVYNQVSGDTGFNLPQLLQNYIKSYFQNEFNVWKQTDSAGGPSPVVLFIPYNDISISDSDLSAAQDAMTYYWDNMPDLTFLYLLRSGTDRVTSLVESDEDIITYTMNTGSTDAIDLSTLSTRMKQVHKRITNSVCSYTQNTQSYSSDSFTDYVQLDYISYYKVSPKYLFGVNSATVKITDIRYGTVAVCYSRRYQYPDTVMQASSSTDITCLTAQSTNEISLSLPCNGYEKISFCPALYISVQGISSTGAECTLTACKDVTDIQIKVTHEGLTCGVGQIMGNFMLIAITILITAKTTMYS